MKKEEVGKLIVLIGPPGSGKTSFAKSEARRIGAKVHSSDEIRKEFPGAKNSQVFKIMRERSFLDLLKGHVVIYDATNTNLRRRMDLYRETKRLSKDIFVGAVVFSHPLRVLQKRNRERYNSVPEEVLVKMYKEMQPPFKGRDCDNLILVGEPFFDVDVLTYPYESLEDLLDLTESKEIREELELCKLPHGNPYHLETIEEHINMCLERSDTQMLKLMSVFHDLGKGITKNGGSFINHAGVSAMYTLNAEYFAREKSANFELTEMVYHHMNAHSYGSEEEGITKRVKERYGLSPELVAATNLFAREIDSPSRVVKEGLDGDFN